MTAGENPLISVVLPVYNAELFIGDSIKSILGQTYSNWELIIIDDGSKDKSAEIIEKFTDPRIHFYRQGNAGMGATLNKAILLAKGKYIARQDADDISLPERFEKQIDFLEGLEEYALVGTWAEIVNEKLEPGGRTHRHPEMSGRLKFELLFDNPFVHSSVMIRMDALKETGLYDLSKDPLIQDYELWWRISKKFQVGNIARALLLYREVGTGMSRTEKRYGEVVAKQSMENILSILERDEQKLTPEELKNLHEFCLLYHSCNSILVKQPDIEKLMKIGAKIEVAAKHFRIDFNSDDMQFYGRHLARSWRSYRIDHPDTPAFSRFFLRIARRINS
ncbi:MAG: glycosyltransferase [Bacteroidota bacterium]|nr:glycosyltransferase [Bacteroidota bacterium]